MLCDEWCEMSGGVSWLRRGGAEAEGGGTEAEGAAGAERKTRTPHSAVGNSNPTGRYHQIEAGRYTANRTGYSLCSAFNGGECEEALNELWCSKSTTSV